MPTYKVLRAFGYEGGTAREGTTVEIDVDLAKKLAKMKPPAVGLAFDDDDEEDKPVLTKPRRARSTRRTPKSDAPLPN